MPSVIGTDSKSGVNVAANYLKNVKANGLGPRTHIVKVVDGDSALTDATLNSVINYLTTSHGTAGTGDSAFVVAGLSGDRTVDGKTLQFVSGTSTTVFLALQGTGEFTAGTADMDIAGVTVSLEATFDQNYGA